MSCAAPHPGTVPGEPPHHVRRQSGACGHRLVDARHLALMEPPAHGCRPCGVKRKSGPAPDSARAQPRREQLHAVAVQVQHRAAALRIVLFPGARGGRPNRPFLLSHQRLAARPARSGGAWRRRPQPGSRGSSHRSFGCRRPPTGAGEASRSAQEFVEEGHERLACTAQPASERGGGRAGESSRTGVECRVGPGAAGRRARAHRRAEARPTPRPSGWDGRSRQALRSDG